MDIKDILAKCDHTLLGVDATWDMIKEVVDDGIKYGTASVCIPSCYVKQASEYAAGRVKICTVIGFPNGYEPEESKVFQAELAVKNGADEVDMVINIGRLKACEYDSVLHEIKAVKEAVGDKILKVIIETCLLDAKDKAMACMLVSESGADYIKTSTGFSKGGATVEDVEFLRSRCAEHVRVKAAGGISSIEDAEKMLKAGADRLGTSRIVKIVKKQGQ